MSRYAKKLYLDMPLEELLKLSRVEVTYDLSDKEQLFCEYYVQNYNLKTAAIKAGYNVRGAHTQAYRIRNRPRCKRYIAWLKFNVADKLQFEISDLIELYMRITFSDMTDFFDIDKKGNLQLKEKKFLDGQLISEIRQSKDGLTLKLVDKLEAAAKLERFFDIMPKEWRERIEEQKVKLMQEKLEFEKEKYNLENKVQGDDGFMDALSKTVKVVWGNENNIEDFGEPENYEDWDSVELDEEPVRNTKDDRKRGK